MSHSRSLPPSLVSGICLSLSFSRFVYSMRDSHVKREAGTILKHSLPAASEKLQMLEVFQFSALIVPATRSASVPALW